jgi:phage tail-like protein
VRKLPALRKYSNITLKRGYTQDKSLWRWYGNIVNGQPDRRDVTIVLLNEARQPVLRWHAESAWINKIEGPSLKAAANEIAMESVELVHEGLTIEM